MIDNRGGKMKSEKAQALIEFVLILPIFIMILFATIDFGRIIISKSQLENKLNEAYDEVKQTADQNDLYDRIVRVVNNDERSNIKVELIYDSETDYMKIKLVEDIIIMTPGLNLILGNKYQASSERVVKYVRQ